MAASAMTTDPETKETVSRCTTVAEKGAHTFEIVGYSLKTKGLGVGKSVRSGTFTVGGCTTGSSVSAPSSAAARRTPPSSTSSC